MIRHLLFLLFFVTLAIDTIGLNLSLAPGLSVKNAFLYLIFVTIALNTALARNRRLELLSVVVPYGICVLYGIFSWLIMVLLVQHPEYSVFSSLVTLKGGLADHVAVFLVFFYGVLNSRDAWWLLRAMLWIVIAANLISVLEALNMPSLDIVRERDDGRLLGPVGEPNQYAALLAFFLPPIMALAVIQRGVLRFVAIVGSVVSGLALLMTASRGGIAGLIGGCGVAAIYLRKYVSPRLVMSLATGSVVFCAVAVAVLYFAGVGDATYGRLVGQTMSGNVFDATSGRSFLWTETLGEMFSHPWSLVTGFGWDAYRELGNFRMNTHNSYLKILYELGIIGLALVLVAFSNVCATARRAVDGADPEIALLLMSFIVGLIAYLTAIFFVDIAAIPWLYVWAFIGVTMRLAVTQLQPSTKAIAPAVGQRSSGVKLVATMR